MMNELPPKLFLRPVSGLVRAAGFWDVFIYDLGIISIGLGAIYTQRYGTAYYSHASISIATIIAGVALLFVVLGLLAWTIAIPRSGGIYVFLSRSGLPGFGFATSFVETLSWLFYAALAAKLICSAVFVPSVALLFGPQSAATLFWCGNAGQFTAASLLIMLSAALLIRGTRTFFVAQKFIFLVALAGTGALLWVLSSHATAGTLAVNLGAWLHLGGVANTAAMTARAKGAGWVMMEGRTTIGASIDLIVWPVLPLIGAAFSIAMGGEIRKTVRNQSCGMLLSLIVATGLFVAIAVLSAGSLGNDIQGASAYLADQNVLNLGGSAKLDPTIVLLSVLGTNNLILRAAILAGFFAWIWFWVPGLIAYGERVVLAWALDRLVPATLGNLHARFGTPYWAIVTAALVTETFLALVIWTEFFATLVFIAAGTIAWALALAFGAVLPYVRRSLFARTNLAVYGWRGRLFMTMACGSGTIAMAWIIVLVCRDPLAIGSPAKAFGTIAACFFSGYVYFRITAARRARLGIDVQRAFDEIPVE